MNKLIKRISPLLTTVVTNLNKLPTQGLGAHLRLQCGLVVLDALSSALRNLDTDGYPGLVDALEKCQALSGAMESVLQHQDCRDDNGWAVLNPDEHTRKLFEHAWTVYSDETYDHSVELVEKRLRANGFDESWFKTKVCFDGGCGTGRLSLAMARMGAKSVVAADVGGESLRFFQTQIERIGLTNIETVEIDVTDLSSLQDGGFDFVASYGVLHHTADPERGIREHFRITRKAGVLWLYLYGAGGAFWHICDQFRTVMRAIDPAVIRAYLSSMRIREGLIYTFIDNFLARREYFLIKDVEHILSGMGPYRWEYVTGVDFVDDPVKQKYAAFGSDLLGPDAEIRLKIIKE